MRKKIILFVSAIILGLVSVIAINTTRFGSRQIYLHPIEKVGINDANALSRFSRALQIKTVSYTDATLIDYQQFLAFHQFIEDQYPLVSRTLEKKVINEYSLLYKWEGSRPDLKPIILAAHLDVTPVNVATWEVDPFSGSIQDGYIWGRGTYDDKGSLISILESVEYLIGQSFQPERTIYLAFGHDEERGAPSGLDGAKRIADYLKEQGVHAAVTIDEGAMLDTDASFIPDKKLALITIAEKGYVTRKLTATAHSGHAMMPPKETAIGILSEALVNVENHPYPYAIGPEMSTTLDYIGPEMPLLQKAAFANRWLFEPLLIDQISKTPSGAAALHTTIAPTVIDGGVIDSALPSSAFALVNIRIMPGETSDDVLKHIQDSIQDERVTVEKYGGLWHEPSKTHDFTSVEYKTIETTVRQVFPDIYVAPFFNLGRSDLIYYRDISENSYNYAPYLYTSQEMGTVHGDNEKISTTNFLNMIQFYLQLIKNFNHSSIESNQ